MRITLTLLNLNGEVRVFAFQDAPQFKDVGSHDDLHHHEVLELLERAGLPHEEATALLQGVLQQPPRAKRRSFDLSPVQLQALRQFAPELIEPL
jgi:hypothetical protein